MLSATENEITFIIISRREYRRPDLGSLSTGAQMSVKGCAVTSFSPASQIKSSDIPTGGDIASPGGPSGIVI